MNLFIVLSNAFNVAVVGASSDLGREILYQGIVERNLKMIGFSSKNRVFVPYRGNSFNKNGEMPEFKNDNLKIENYWGNVLGYNYDHIIFCTSAKPFQEDYSDELTNKFIKNLPISCKSISLVSAFGVGDSLKDGNLGIQVMNNVYLKDVYRAKNIQEKLLKDDESNITKIIYRPRALSYGSTKLKSISRQQLAKEILDDLDL